MSAHSSAPHGSNTLLLPRAHRSIGRGVAAWLANFGRPLLLALRVVESRRLLRQMDDRMLSDIGLSRCDAAREASRMPWDLGNRTRG